MFADDFVSAVLEPAFAPIHFPPGHAREEGAGVCSGISLYLGIDVVIIRVLFLVALLCGSAGFWIYVVFWIAAPAAVTAAEKCEMRGVKATAENIKKYTTCK